MNATLARLSGVKTHLAVIAALVGMAWFVARPAADEYIRDRIAAQSLAPVERVDRIERLIEEQGIRQQNMNRELGTYYTDREVMRLQLQTLERLIEAQDERAERQFRELRRLLLRP